MPELQHLTLLIPKPKSVHDTIPVSYLSYIHNIMHYHTSNKYHDVALSKFYIVLVQHTSWLSQVRRFSNNPITVDLFWLVTTHSLVDGTDIPKWTVSTLLSGLVLTWIWTQQVTPKHWYSAKQHYVTFQKNCLYNHRNNNLQLHLITVMRTSNVFIIAAKWISSTFYFTWRFYKKQQISKQYP